VVGRQLETTEEDLIQTVFPHPTLSEMMHESVLDAWDRAIHIKGFEVHWSWERRERLSSVRLFANPLGGWNNFPCSLKVLIF
jgi:hypothetical protein